MPIVLGVERLVQSTSIYDVSDMVVFTQTGRGAYLREEKQRERSSFESGTDSHHHHHLGQAWGT